VIAATVFPTNNLNSLQTANESANGFVAADTDKVNGGFNGVLSPLLTVWRKLHLEVDSMTAVPTNGPEANFVSEKIASTKPNQPNAGQTTLHFGFKQQPWQVNQFENGSLTIADVATNYPIVGNGAGYYLPGFENFAIVSGLVPTNLMDATCQLRDDADRLKTELQLPSLPLDGLSQQIITGKNLVHSTRKVRGVAAVYRPAFIEVVDANAAGWNTNRTIPFYLNKDVFDFLFSGVFDDAQDIHDSSLFWAHTVTMGYQPDSSEDGDPDTELPVYGTTPETPGTWTAHGYSAIYEEAIRERAWKDRQVNTFAPSFYGDLEFEYYGWLLGTIAHEVALYSTLDETTSVPAFT